MVCRNAKTSAQWFCRQIILNEWTVAVLFSVPGEPKHKQDLCYRGDAEYLAAYKPQLLLWQLRIIYNETDIHVPARNAVTRPPASCDKRRSIIIHHDLCHGLSHNAVYCTVRHKMDRSPDSFSKRKNRGLGALVRRLVLSDEIGSNLGIPIFNCQGWGLLIPSIYNWERNFDFTT